MSSGIGSFGASSSRGAGSSSSSRHSLLAVSVRAYAEGGATAVGLVGLLRYSRPLSRSLRLGRRRSLPRGTGCWSSCTVAGAARRRGRCRDRGGADRLARVSPDRRRGWFPRRAVPRARPRAGARPLARGARRRDRLQMTFEGLATLLGPALAGVVLAGAAPPAALVVAAGFSLVSTLLVTGVRAEVDPTVATRRDRKSVRDSLAAACGSSPTFPISGGHRRVLGAAVRPRPAQRPARLAGSRRSVSARVRSGSSAARPGPASSSALWAPPRWSGSAGSADRSLSRSRYRGCR